MRNIKFIVLSTLLFTGGAFTSCNKTSPETNYDVMVVGVDHKTFKETEILIRDMNKQMIDNLPFYTGQIGNKKVVVAESDFGMSEAAMMTTIGIKHFNPKAVISEGSAGGHHKDVHLYDVVLGKEILDMSSYHGDVGDVEHWELQNPNLSSDERLLETASTIENKYGGVVKPNGVIASSDAWNTSVDFVNKLHDKFKEDCEEMEAYAVANVCEYYNIPSLAIKMISNNLITEEEYDSKVCAAVQYFTIDVIKAI